MTDEGCTSTNRFLRSRLIETWTLFVIDVSSTYSNH
jgi:hypothetical protein